MKNSNVNAMNTPMEELKNLLLQSQYTCVVQTKGSLLTSNERGVKPLLDWLDGGLDLTEGYAADRVVGNGAAFLYVLLNVKEIYAHVLSRPAAHTLERHGIRFTYGTLTDAIQNRAKTGNCPIEDAVSGETDPNVALQKIRARLKTL